MIELKTLLFTLIIIISVIIYNLKKRYSYWKDRNVPHVSGISKDFVFKFREHSGTEFEKIYAEFSDRPYVGYYHMGKPCLMIRDTKLIQLVLMKDFAHFVDRGINQADEKVDPLGTFPVGEKWKKIRSKQTQIFTSGKLKSMYSLLNDCVNILDKHVGKIIKKSRDIEIRNIFSKFSMDVVGACIFGLHCNAIEDDNSEFRLIGRKLGSNPLKQTVRLVLNFFHPKIVSWLKIKAFPQEVEDFFFSITRDTIKHRKENANKRNDFMQLFINLKEEEEKMLQNQAEAPEPIFTETLIAKSVFGFFAAGSKAISSCLAFCLYELALNPSLMEKLYQEIVRVKNTHGTINYDALNEMHYMETVISETMRLHTPISVLSRVCTKSYEVPGSSLVIEKNTSITIPVFSLHQDPKYFPDPEKFDPERFNGENKPKIIPGTYLPLGDGPRKCIAIRFAKMEMKTALALIIEKYSIHPTEKTQIPIILDPRPFANAPLHGIHLRFQQRE